LKLSSVLVDLRGEIPSRDGDDRRLRQWILQQTKKSCRITAKSFSPLQFQSNSDKINKDANSLITLHPNSPSASCPHGFCLLLFSSFRVFFIFRRRFDKYRRAKLSFGPLQASPSRQHTRLDPLFSGRQRIVLMNPFLVLVLVLRAFNQISF
jgi:hypothetical protein